MFKVQGSKEYRSHSQFSILNSQFFFLLFSFLLFSSLPCFGQAEKLPPPQSMQNETPLKRKIPKFTVGGDFGFQLGTFNTVNVMPQVGVYATPWLLAVLSGEYSYMWRKNYYNSHVWGVGAALQPCIIKKIIIHVGYEFTQVHFKWLDGSPKQIQDFHYVVLGAGYKYYVTQNVYLQTLVLLNIPLNKPEINNFSYNYYPYFKFGVGVDL